MVYPRAYPKTKVKAHAVRARGRAAACSVGEMSANGGSVGEGGARTAAAAVLRLDHFTTGRKGHPLARGQPSSVPVELRTVTVGRNPQAIVRVSKAMKWISNWHFSLSYDESGFQLRDMSSNGTWVNGERVARERPHPLHLGDIIELAAEDEGKHEQVQFLLESPEAAGKAPEAAPDDEAAPVAKRPCLAGDDDTRSVISSDTLAPTRPRQLPQSEAAEDLGRPRMSPSGDLDELRMRAERAEAELATERAIRVDAAARWDAEAHRVLGDELRLFEDVQSECIVLQRQLEAANKDHDAERERLTQCATDANLQLQRLMQEKSAVETKLLQHSAATDTAERRRSELEASLSAEQASCVAAKEQVRRAHAEVATLRANVASLASSLHSLVKDPLDMDPADQVVADPGVAAASRVKLRPSN